MQNWQNGKRRQQQTQVAVSVYYHTVCSIASHVIVLAFNLWGGVCVCFGFIKKEVLGQFDKGHGYAG